MNRKPGARGKPGFEIVEAIAAPVFVFMDHHIYYANPAAYDLTGFDGEELSGKELRRLLLPAEGEARLCLSEAFDAEEVSECRARLQTSNSELLPVNVVARRVPSSLFALPENSGGPITLVTVTDLSTEQIAEQHAEQLAAEARHRANELTEVINAMPDAVVILDPEGRMIQANPAAREMMGFDPTGMDREQMAERIRIREVNGEPVNSNDLPHNLSLQGEKTRGQRLALTLSNGKSLDLLVSASPLLADNRMVGVVSVWSDVSELTQRRNELETLLSFASALRNAIIQEEMFPIILEQLVNLLKVEGASLLLPEPVSGDMTVRLGVGDWSHTTGQRLQKGAGVTWRVMEEGTTYVNNQIQTDPRLVRSIFAGDLPCGACMALSSHNTSIGAVWVARHTPFAEEEVRIMSGIADIAASNIYRARLFEQTQLRFQRLSALHSIDMAITSSLDLQLTLSVLLDQAVTQMNVDAADILLFETALHWLRFASGRGFVQPNASREPRSLGDSPAGQVALERRTISIPDLGAAEVSTQYWMSPDEGFQAYFAAPLIAKGQVKGVLELYHREPRYPDSEWFEFLETLATQAAIAIDNAELFERLQHSNEELSLAYDATIEGWSHALELRDQETHGHAQRVTELTIRLARRLGVRDDEISHYRRGVLLHDIGKMAIPDRILLKEGPLTPEEQEVMRQHPVYAYELLYPISYLRPALDIPYAHHEWYDGTGYPRRLKGEEIPLSARIFAVVDVWDALRSDRSYRPAWPVHKVIEHIRSLAGTHFDPRVVEEFIKMMQDTIPISRSRYNPMG